MQTITKTYQLALTVVMKNCEPLESGPVFTMATTPAQSVQFSLIKTYDNKYLCTP